MELYKDNYVQFQATTDNCQDYYIAHENFLGWIRKLTEDSVDLLQLNATFKLVPGLAGSDGISLESKNFPGYFLRHQNYRFKLHQNDGSDLFSKDATFHLRLQEGEGEVRFESFNFPGHFIRHFNYELWLSNGTGGGPQTANLFRPDTTFVICPLSRYLTVEYTAAAV